MDMVLCAEPIVPVHQRQVCRKGSSLWNYLSKVALVKVDQREFELRHPGLNEFGMPD